jgi:hypothetical protein
MDPILEVDGEGNGRVIIYRYGKTWRIPVKNWVGEKLPYQPPDNIMNRIAQSELDRLKNKNWTNHEY